MTTRAEYFKTGFLSLTLDMAPLTLDIERLFGYISVQRAVKKPRSDTHAGRTATDTIRRTHLPRKWLFL